MTTRTLKRGSPPRRATVKRRVQPKPSRIDWLLTKLPVSEATLRKVATVAMLTLGGVAATAGAVALGVPALVGEQMGEAAGRAGFRVQQIEITGLKRMDRMSVYAVALDQQSRAMPLVDLEAVRGKLLRYGWIEDAHVSRRLPDTLLVDIVERKPAAVWQDRGRLTLIDKEGVLLEPVDANAIPDLPLIIGPGAHLQEAAYQRLLDAAPALKPRVRAATWVGNRRWDLRFDSGETLKLPEENAAAALLDFAKRDGANPLLGRGWVSFDMRDPDKLVARKPDPATAREVADPEPTTSTIAANTGTEG
jgi:cell division protein FtsQ